MNLVVIPEEQLEKLPKRQRGHLDWWDDYNHGDGFPWRHAQRWLEANVGRHLNSILHEFVRAKWVPARFRKKAKLSELVQLTTFLKDGKIWFFPRYGIEAVPVETYYHDMLYIHPDTGLLCYKPRPKKREKYADRSRREQAKYYRYVSPYHQLLKIDGFWFYVWCEPNERQKTHIKPNEILLPTESYKYKPEYNPNASASWVFQDPSRPKIYKQQLNSKQLKRWKLKNDPPKPRARCKTCGSVNCTAHRDINA